MGWCCWLTCFEAPDLEPSELPTADYVAVEDGVLQPQRQLPTSLSKPLTAVKLPENTPLRHAGATGVEDENTPPFQPQSWSHLFKSPGDSPGLTSPSGTMPFGSPGMASMMLG